MIRFQTETAIHANEDRDWKTLFAYPWNGLSIIAVIEPMDFVLNFSNIFYPNFKLIQQSMGLNRVATTRIMVRFYRGTNKRRYKRRN